MKLASWTSSDFRDVTLEQCLSAATAIDLAINPELRDGESATGGYSFDAFGFW